ncbi:hypothetical protein RN001_014715 [Aquatica leii]|uniref:Glomulin n=1 Tax=Aquatica leii TaxID=1421715 RepID=A0AAN7S6B7_9COLE|nr:hypothetical protein RN001_014715 [Aquatica leii]
MEESNNFLKQIEKYVCENNVDDAVALIKNHRNEISNILADVVPFLLTKTDIRCSEQILIAFAEECDPEEVLLQLIEDIDRCTEDAKFLVMCQALLRALLRLPEKRLNSLGWGLNAVHSYLLKINLPDNVELNEDEEILMDADTVVERISFLCASLLPFYSALVDNCKNDGGERKIVVLKFVLQVLGKPLAFLDLKSGKTTSKARRISERIVEMIFELNADIFAISDLGSGCDIGCVDALALSTLFYLVLSEKVEVRKVPKVYDNVYVFQESVALAAELFKYESQFVQHNGLCLIEVIIDRIRTNSLSYLLLDSEHHNHFCKALTRIIVYSHLEVYRKKGLDLYRRYLFLFEPKGRYLIVYNLMGILNHTGIIGYTVTQYKDMMMHELDKSDLSPYFTKSNLFRVLDRFCLLPNQEESDLIELADQIVAALNLLRYLIIRDKANVTGIWDYLKKLENTYLVPMKTALTLSRAHYELKIKDLKDESGEGDKGDSKVSVTVAGHTLNELPTNEKIKFLYSALTTFDVIENLLCRINELIEM